jgi:SAM-dependent methyltransferase
MARDRIGDLFRFRKEKERVGVTARFVGIVGGGLILLAAVLGPAWAGTAQHPAQKTPEEYARMLEDPSRAEWQKPEQVVTTMHLAPTDVVADIGAGSGYFTRRIAPHVAKVLAVDIDPDLLAIAAQHAPKNVRTVLAADDDPKLPPRSVNIIFFCNVLHHIESRPAYYNKLRKALKPNGRVVVVDFYKKDIPIGPPVSRKLSEAQVIGEFRTAGFRVSKSLDFLKYQYFLVFRYRGKGMGLGNWFPVHAD